ncbi:AsmA-like C-terminal region-containing protein [Flammeovirgaceae bacterium SG7u.111]|nr:AsmA-like C-terminal region-containing protein [Flammeovirgaceae bacterium SG7u.132]WPO34884.1 AsmA-like C-terminal region-containing protein [Flammeovirgaceae bacterium SG7u.111]
MKKFLYIILGILAVVVILAAVLPIVYKDDIRALVEQQIDENVNADVYFDADEFSVSLFRDFPNLNVSLGNFGVVGKAPFAGDTLTSISEFSVSVDLFSLMGDQIVIEEVSLVDPYINIMVKEDGTANYDIAKASGEEEVVTEEESSGEMAFQVNGWSIENGRVIYDDKSLPTFLEIQGLNHSGSGDFTLEVFDLETSTKMESITVDFDGVKYLENNVIDAEITMNIDLSDVMSLTFKENLLKVNDFAMGFDGFIKMPGDDIVMDITFEAKENEFKNILSLVPGVFLEGFEDLKTDGSLAFGGFVKGTFNETTMPGFKVDLNVEKGMFQYPDLPTAINNILVDMHVDAESGVYDDMIVDIRKFHMDLGKNPVNGRVKIAGLEDMDVDADVSAKLNLADLSSMFPMEGLSMAGMYSLGLKAKGVYSDAKGTIPQINADMALNDGKIAYADYPVPMEKIHVQTQIINENGILNDTRVEISDASMLVDGEPLKASGKIYNLNDLTWNFKVNGGLDFTILDKIYPLEDMHLTGKIKADIVTSGKMSDVDAERYDKLPTSGSVTIDKLKFTSVDLPQGLTIDNAIATFNPRTIELSKYEGALGKSDMKIKGSLSNYIAYALKDNEVLKGNFSMTSNTFDANEWMTEEEETATADTTTEEYGVVPIPKTLDFRFDANIAKVLYEDMVMDNMKGNITMKDGVMGLNNLRFGLLGGKFTMNGAYDTKDPEKPKFDFDMGIAALSFAKSYETFNTVQTFAPLAKNIDGDFSTNLKLKGGLGQDMMPLYETLTGGGKVIVKDAAVVGLDILTKMSEITKIKELSNPKLKDILVQTKFEDGKMKVEPFKFDLEGIATEVAGSTSFTGDLDYKVNMVIPLEKFGADVAAQYSALTGTTQVPLVFNVAGNYDDPKVGLEGDPWKSLAEQQANKIKKEASAEAQKQIGAAVNVLQDTTLTDEEKKKKMEEMGDDLSDDAKKALEKLKKLPFGKKKEN